MADVQITKPCLPRKPISLNRRELFYEMCKVEFLKLKHEFNDQSISKFILSVEEFDSKLSTQKPVVAKLLEKTALRPPTIVIYRLVALETAKDFASMHELIVSSMQAIMSEYLSK